MLVGWLEAKRGQTSRTQSNATTRQSRLALTFARLNNTIHIYKSVLQYRSVMFGEKIYFYIEWHVWPSASALIQAVHLICESDRMHFELLPCIWCLWYGMVEELHGFFSIHFDHEPISFGEFVRSRRLLFPLLWNIFYIVDVDAKRKSINHLGYFIYYFILALVCNERFFVVVVLLS